MGKFLTVLALALSTCVAAPVLAQGEQIIPAPIEGPSAVEETFCGPLDEMMDIAINEYGELPVGFGISEVTGEVIQLFVNEETGTYVIMSTIMADGFTCVVDYGSEFVKAKVKPNV